MTALDELRADVAALRNELAELRAEARMRGALDEMTERLDRIEARQPLRTVGKALTA